MFTKFIKLRIKLEQAELKGRNKERKHNKRILKSIYTDWEFQQKKNRILQRNAVWNLEQTVDRLNTDHKSEINRINNKFAQKEKELDKLIDNNHTKDLKIEELKSNLVNFMNKVSLRINKIVKEQEDRLSNSAIAHANLKEIIVMRDDLAKLLDTEDKKR